jgi:uncharacterized membrane protein
MFPNAKVIAGALGGAVATIVLWLVSFYGGVDLPAEVAAAVTTIIVAIVAYLTSEPLPEPPAPEPAPDEPK